MRDTPLQGRHHVVQSGGSQRRDHPNPTRHQRQRTFAAWVEQPLAFELGFELQKLLKQSALPGPAHAFDDQLQITPGLVHAQAAAHLDQLTVARRKVKRHRRPAKHGATQLPTFILQRKITVTTGRLGETRDFAPHRHRVEARLQRVSNGAAQRANGPHPGVWQTG